MIGDNDELLFLVFLVNLSLWWEESVVWGMFLDFGVFNFLLLFDNIVGLVWSEDGCIL